MRESPGFRETVEWLTEQTNSKGWLSTTEIASVLGVDRHTVTKRFGISRGCARYWQSAWWRRADE